MPASWQGANISKNTFDSTEQCSTNQSWCQGEAYIKRKNERIKEYKPIKTYDDQQLYICMMGKWMGLTSLDVERPVDHYKSSVVFCPSVTEETTH